MLIDAIGTQHKVASENVRIVSLVPSLTELLFDLGLGPQVVGRTGFCIHPHAEIKSVESVGGTKKINFEKLQQLRPDYVLLNVDENPKEIADELQRRQITCIVTHPLTVADNPALYELLGDIFNRPNEALFLQKQFSAAFDRLEKSRALRPRRRVLYIIWRDPWMTISPATYIADLLNRVNWQVAGPFGEARYPVFQFADLDLDEIDLVLFSSEPYAFSKSHIAEFADRYPDHAKKACLIDGELLSWYGSRAIRALPYLDHFSSAPCR
ncbi:MAG: ABC transporter substrate-binding protein [Rhodospirillales bacterium]|nr:ABC transporter substrate-binding protein [Rhodospirillales bacterium]